MAGAKETPRQKMIGMMYLVLTAMLALQVSSALLEKFILLNNSLEQSTGAANKVNQNTFASIQQTVEKSGNRAADLAVVRQAEEVRKMTATIVADLDALKERIITEAGGGLDESGNIKNPSEEEGVAGIMVGPNRNGEAYKLKQQLDQYIQNLSKYTPTKYGSLALDGKEDPIAVRSPEQRRKDFAELNFAQTPVPAALAVLTQRQSDIRRIEGETLNYLATKVGAQDVKFDKILAMLSMESKVVVAGTKFKGEMFLAASSSGIQPRMSLNGGPVRVQDGRGIIEFTAQGGAYDKNGLARRVLTGNISYQQPNGESKTVTFNQEYFVAKPSYQIETGTMPPLYLGCENKLSIQSPQLGALWNPSFSADGGSVIQSGEKGKITIVPSAASLRLNISNGGNLLGTEPFRVNRVPRPTLEYVVGGRPATDPRGVPVTAARSVSVRAVADPSFANYAPNDARFRVSGMTVSLVRGTRRVQGVQLGAGGGSISALAAEAQPGDRLVIQVDGVQRQNFRGEISEVPMGSPLQQVSLY
ncbi:gliding motility-associated protein GldM [Fibrisoma limi BUZ 3]|uniref:Gliding motility-associated protein GldM n=1 Tax=Fibrisoma limi BUZ 3 TaxID=1185876 RepID=I2GP25_9BACT|nr:gliding motility protein GldM [Fibrisoma limi]CCH55653.1 gliding motility-associated protein GldM [Fibrisoma limi BUZ 3]